MKPPYDIVLNPSTVKIKVSGDDLPALFSNAALALFVAMMGSTDFGGEPFEVTVSVRSVDEETLMVDWLSRLLELAYMENVAVKSVTIKQFAPNALTASLQGYYVDLFEQELGEISLDDMAIRETDDGFEAVVRFGD